LLLFFFFFSAVMAATYLAAQVTVPLTITLVTSNNTIPASRQQYRHHLAEGQSVGGIPNRAQFAPR
jgi:hypothetical protein